MFYFPFYAPPYFFTPQPLAPCSLNTYPLASSPKQFSEKRATQSNQRESQQEQKEEQIILTKQDLQALGYDTNKKVWTEEEDQLLLFLREKKKMSWVEISKRIPQRNQKMCYSRYRRLSSSTKNHWLKKHDDDLVRLVQQIGQDWIQIAKRFKDRNPRQVKDRYTNFLKPGIKDSEWNLEDDLKLISLVNLHGMHWKKVGQGLSGRSLSQIKNRFYGRIRKLNQQKIAHLGLH